MFSIFKFKLKDRVRNTRGDFGTVLGRAVYEEVNRVGTLLIYTVMWDGDLAMQVPEECLAAVSSYKAGNVVFYKDLECVVHSVNYLQDNLSPVKLALYATGYPCREQFYVDEKEVTRERPAPKKLGADALKVKLNIGDLPEVQKVLSEAALKISEQHCAQLGRDIEDQPPKNAEVERLEDEVTRLATELDRVRGEKE